MSDTEKKKRIEEIIEEIETIKGNWPAHTPRPYLLIRLEGLEAEYKELTGKDYEGQDKLPQAG